MKPTGHSSAASPRPLLRGLLFAAVTLALLPAWLWSAEAPVAVFTQTFNDYQRTHLPDQSFKAETYAFGEGGTWGLDNPAVGANKLTFMRVARAAALSLAQANYVPTRNPNEAGLFILVYWGRTIGSNEAVHHTTTGAFSNPFSGAAAAGASGMGLPLSSMQTSLVPTGSHGGTQLVTTSREHHGQQNDAVLYAMAEQASLEKPERDRIDNSNGHILGYSAAIQQARTLPSMLLLRDAVDEVARNRYYVVLLAYDFRIAWKEKKLKPLWEARISVDEDRNGLDHSLERMLAAAMQKFGQDSGGLRRDFVPNKGSVTTGPLEVLEYMPPTK